MHYHQYIGSLHNTHERRSSLSEPSGDHCKLEIRRETSPELEREKIVYIPVKIGQSVMWWSVGRSSVASDPKNILRCEKLTSSGFFLECYTGVCGWKIAIMHRRPIKSYTEYCDLWHHRTLWDIRRMVQQWGAGEMDTCVCQLSVLLFRFIFPGLDGRLRDLFRIFWDTEKLFIFEDIYWETYSWFIRFLVDWCFLDGIVQEL